MAKRDILKEAIADAKAVKETAIANAKAALEEAFTPQLKSMLAAKLEEMEIDEEKEDLEEKKKYKDDDRKDGGESKETKRTEKMKYGKDLAESDIDEEINLDEILAELEEEMDDKDDINEADESEAERADVDKYEYEEGKEEGEEEADDETEDEEIDLEDMTDDDLKGFIEDVIADMVGSGELEAGDNFEKEDEDTEVEVGMEVDSEEEVEINEEMDEKVDEINTTTGQSARFTDFDRKKGDPLRKTAGGEIAKAVAKAADNFTGWTKEKIEAFKKWNDEMSKPASPAQAKIRKAGTGKPGTFLGLEEELDEAYSTIKSLRSDLNEVNLLNAKLLYTNKIFRAKTLTESQKVKVLGAFDKAGTVKETKLVFETLSDGLKTKKSPIKESLGRASKPTGNFKTRKNPIVETDPMVARFQKLAGLK